MAKTVYQSASDYLLHGKDSDRTERIILPITRYGNILSAPSVVTEDIEVNGAPFHLLKTGTVKLTAEEIHYLCGHIV